MSAPLALKNITFKMVDKKKLSGLERSLDNRLFHYLELLKLIIKKEGGGQVFYLGIFS